MASRAVGVASGLERVLREEDRSIRWLAVKLDLDPSYVWKMVRGIRPLTEDFKAGAAKLLARPVEQLFPDPDQAVSA